jgi:hypothetical protein
LYLDEMISPRVAEGLRRKGHDVATAAERGALGSTDARQLALAIEESRALVTFDLRDFSVLARAVAVAGTEHWGIILVPPARFSRSSIGELVGALDRFLSRNADLDAIKNRAVFLGRE